MGHFSIHPFGQVLEDVQEARAWYSHLGIPTVGTRLEIIEDRAKKLLHDLENLPPEESIDRWHNADTYYVLSDGEAFGRIAREMSKVGPNLLPRKKLRTILEGPLVPTGEELGDGSVNARNIFAELELAAKLSESKIYPTGFDDLQFSFRNVDFSVEVKRLLSGTRVQSNVDQAYTQVKERLATDHDRGLVALAVEKVMGLEEQILNVQPGNTPDDAVRKIAQDFQAQFGQSWRNFVDTRVIGILLIVRFLCLTTSSNIIGPAYYLVMISLVGPETLQGTERQLLLALRAQFRTKIGG